MFGYMGFGMQSWIYKRNPRTFLAKRDRTPSFSTLPMYDKNFELKHRDVRPKRHNGLLIIFIVTVFTIIAGFYYSKFDIYSSKQTKLVNERMSVENREAFDYLMSSGYTRLNRNNLVGAYSEFILAYNIDSKNDELNTLIIETLSILCEKDSRYCNKLDRFIENF